MNPLLVFGGGEYTVTDIFYAASRGKNCEVFKLVFDFAVSSRFVTGKGKVIIPSVYKWEMSNRAVHAASRGGNVEVLEMFLAYCCDVLAYRDAQGSTVLHSAAATSQLEVIFFYSCCVVTASLKFSTWSLFQTVQNSPTMLEIEAKNSLYTTPISWRQLL